MINAANYRQYPAVSNSDLSWVKSLFQPKEEIGDKIKAYAFGNLFDAIITEPHRVNYFKFTVDGQRHSEEDFAICCEMKKQLEKDRFWQAVKGQCNFQHISHVPEFQIQHDEVKFALPAKCKWDFKHRLLPMGGDLKTTSAGTQKQFIEACHNFDYFRSRAWYMDLEGTNEDMLIGVSKVNMKVFKLPIRRGDELYNLGKQQYQELAFKYWYLFV